MSRERRRFAVPNPCTSGPTAYRTLLSGQLKSSFRRSSTIDERTRATLSCGNLQVGKNGVGDGVGFLHLVQITDKFIVGGARANHLSPRQTLIRAAPYIRSANNDTGPGAASSRPVSATIRDSGPTQPHAARRSSAGATRPCP